MKLLLTPSEAGEMLGVSDDVVRRLVAELRLPAVYPHTTNRGLRLYHAHVERYAAELADEADRELEAARAARRREKFGRRTLRAS